MQQVSQTKRKELRDYFDISNISISKKKNGFNDVSDYYEFLQKKYELETQIAGGNLFLTEIHQSKKQPEKTKSIIFSFDEFKSIGLITDENIRDKKYDELFNKATIEQKQAEQDNILDVVLQEITQIKAEKNKADQLKADQLKADQLKADQLKADQLKADQLKADELKAEKIKADQLKAEKIKADQLKADQLKADKQKVIKKIKEFFANDIKPKSHLIEIEPHDDADDTEFLKKTKELKTKLVADILKYSFDKQTNIFPFYVFFDTTNGQLYINIPSNVDDTINEFDLYLNNTIILQNEILENLLTKNTTDRFIELTDDDKKIYINKFIASKEKIKRNEELILELEKIEQDKKQKNRLKNKKKKQKKKQRLNEQKDNDMVDDIIVDILINETTSDIITDETTSELSSDVSSDISSDNTTNIYDDIYTIQKPLIQFHFNLSISKTEMKQIINLLNNLYYDNDTHAKFLYMNNFTKIKVLKKIHFGFNETDSHFNIRYINVKENIYSNEYHMYIKNNKIYRMTKLQSTVFS